MDDLLKKIGNNFLEKMTGFSIDFFLECPKCTIEFWVWEKPASTLFPIERSVVSIKFEKDGLLECNKEALRDAPNL